MVCSVVVTPDMSTVVCDCSPVRIFLRLRLRQLPERAAVLVDLREERPNLRIDPRVGCGVRGCCGNLGHEACSNGQGCEFRKAIHGDAPLSVWGQPDQLDGAAGLWLLKTYGLPRRSSFPHLLFF